MIIIYKNTVSALNDKYEEGDSYIFLLPNKRISKYFTKYMNKFGLHKISDEFLERTKNTNIINDTLLKKYIESPLELLYTNNLYKNTEKLLDLVFEAISANKNIITDCDSAAFLINEMYLRKMKVTSIKIKEESIRIYGLAEEFSKIHNPPTSPFVIERYFKLFSIFNTKALSDEEISTIGFFQKKLLSISNTDNLEEGKKVKEYISNHFPFEEEQLLINIIYKRYNIALENEEYIINSINIYFKLIELIKYFYKSIKEDYELLISESKKTIIIPNGSRIKAEYYFKNILKDVIPTYKKLDEEFTIQQKLSEIDSEDEDKLFLPEKIQKEEELLLEQKTKKLNICVLIDADNASVNALSGIFNELSKYGNIIIRKAYGNWSRMTSSKWENAFRELAIQPIHQIDYTKGKNSTDIAMTIDAMDLLYANKDIINSFALITSDSDFTPLAIRLVQAGLTVLGFGEEKTPAPFINSCSQFVFTENLQEELDKSNNIEKIYKNQDLMKVLSQIIEDDKDEEGWVRISLIGIRLSSRTTISPISYGFKSYGQLLRSLPKIYDYKQDENNQYLMKKKGYKN